MIEISSKSIAKSSSRLSTKNAWAQYVRRRFNGLNLVKACQAEWDLSEGEARGLVYAMASQATIDKVLEAEGPFAGFGLGLEILAIKTGVHLEAFIEKQAEEARREAAQWNARERTLEALSARVAERRSFRRAGNQ